MYLQQIASSPTKFPVRYLCRPPALFYLFQLFDTSVSESYQKAHSLIPPTFGIPGESHEPFPTGP